MTYPALTYQQQRDQLLTNQAAPYEIKKAVQALETLDPHDAVTLAAALLRLATARAMETPHRPLVSYQLQGIGTE